MVGRITVYTAKKVITMNPTHPEATAVAVKDGKILGVGSSDELEKWNPDDINDRFNDKVLMPGFVEAHSHSSVGDVWSLPYIGYFDRTSPSGEKWPGRKDVEEIINALTKFEDEKDDPDEPLVAWGVEPIYLEKNFDAEVLDQVSKTRPIFVLHCNGHVATINSALLEHAGITSKTNVEGVVKDTSGKPTGVLQEKKAMRLTNEVYHEIRPKSLSEEAIRNYGKIARNSGITTVGEVGGPELRNSNVVNRWKRVVDNENYPVRVSFAYSPSLADSGDISHEENAQYLYDLSQESTDKIRFGIAKFFTDGSIQGYTARLNWPGYYTKDSNGIWLTPPEKLRQVLKPYHERGLTIFCHCNGDEASAVFIDVIESLQEESTRMDHRHSIQHCQMAPRAQYRRMAELGICANIFSNHIYYYGDQHREVSVGPERAKRMNACATANQTGVPFTLHSDAPVTPMSQLHTAWCAVNRLTATNEVLGKDEQISVKDALKAVTLGAAYQLNMDHEIGSIETGKYADFTVLESDPLSIDPMKLREISVWGTIVGGRLHPSGV